MITATVTENVETITATLTEGDETVTAYINENARGPSGGGGGAPEAHAASHAAGGSDALTAHDIGAFDSSDATTGGGGNADSGKLVQFQDSGGIAGQSASTGEPGVYALSDAVDAPGLQAGAVQGSYHAVFGHIDSIQSAVERVRGWFVWFYGSFVGRLKTADITASREWTLPDKSGTLATIGDIYTVPVTRATSYSPGLADVGVAQMLTQATSTQTVTLAAQSTVAWPDGAELIFCHTGAATLALAGVSVNNVAALADVPANGWFALKRLGSDNWQFV